MRNNVTFESLQKVLPKLKKFIESNGMDAEVVEEAEIQIKYKGYIEREKFIAEKLHRSKISLFRRISIFTRSIR